MYKDIKILWYELKIVTLWPSPGGDGAEVIYALRNNNVLANLILTNLELAGQNIRDAYQRRLPSDTSKDYYFIHRNTGVTEPVIVEYGFLDSTLDDPTQLKLNYEKYADAVINAVLEYIGFETETTNTYTVKSGDTLWGIAKKFNLTVNQIKEANNLTSNSLSIGQKLIIPSQTETPTLTNFYTVKQGDTLYSIAKKYNVSVNDIINANNLTTTNLSIGQTITIPTDTETKVPTPQPTEQEYTIYTVKSGDSLYSIAQKYNTTMQKIIDLNNLSTTLLSIGQKLKIPTTTSSQVINYTVKSGDNLYTIAKKYNTTVNELMEFNNLKTNLLSVGQTIKIPSSNTYVVKKGDNLYSIAKKFDTTVDQIKAKNNLTTNNLTIGQTLTI